MEASLRALVQRRAGNRCAYCNRCKGPNLTRIDPRTRKIVRLFHPRRHKWSRHFVWERARLVGRTTIVVLQINHPDPIAPREALIESGAFPPPGS